VKGKEKPIDWSFICTRVMPRFFTGSCVKYSENWQKYI